MVWPISFPSFSRSEAAAARRYWRWRGPRCCGMTWGRQGAFLGKWGLGIVLGKHGENPSIPLLFEWMKCTKIYQKIYVFVFFKEKIHEWWKWWNGNSCHVANGKQYWPIHYLTRTLPIDSCSCFEGSRVNQCKSVNQLDSFWGGIICWGNTKANQTATPNILSNVLEIHWVVILAS